VASCSAQIQGLARSKLISCLISKVVRDLVQVLMTFLMRLSRDAIAGRKHAGAKKKSQ